MAAKKMSAALIRSSSLSIATFYQIVLCHTSYNICGLGLMIGIQKWELCPSYKYYANDPNRMGTRDVALVLFVGTALVLSAVIFVFQAEQRASAADAGSMMMEGAM